MAFVRAQNDEASAGGAELMYDVRDIANFTLDFADQHRTPVTNLALQKLLYFLHGWFSSVFDEPLIKNRFEAWQYGPVQRVIYDQFKKAGSSPIKGTRAEYIDPLNGSTVYRAYSIQNDHADILRLILEKYTQYTASQLVQESHVEDGPWEYVWEQANDLVYPGMKIPDALIVDHFKRMKPILMFH